MNVLQHSRAEINVSEHISMAENLSLEMPQKLVSLFFLRRLGEMGLS